MKYSGSIGFWNGDVEVSPDVWVPNIIERRYVGDVLRNYKKFQQESDKQNENLVLYNQISILADLYMKQNLSSIRYVIWNDVKWKVSSVEIVYPRVILEIGGVYNGSD